MELYSKDVFEFSEFNHQKFHLEPGRSVRFNNVTIQIFNKILDIV